VNDGIYGALVEIAKKGLTVTLFLIGAGLSPAVLRKVGLRPFLQGIFLWIVISLASLWTVVNLL
jgi:uncharacterized membrane protein YadS